MDNSLNTTCPATMLATNRILNDKGRIAKLISSIKQIKGLINIGVPLGTREALKEVIEVRIRLYINDINKAKPRPKTIGNSTVWGVRIGNKPRELLVNTKKRTPDNNHGVADVFKFIDLLNIRGL